MKPFIISRCILFVCLPWYCYQMIKFALFRKSSLNRENDPILLYTINKLWSQSAPLLIYNHTSNAYITIYLTANVSQSLLYNEFCKGRYFGVWLNVWTLWQIRFETDLCNSVAVVNLRRFCKFFAMLLLSDFPSCCSHPDYIKAEE